MNKSIILTVVSGGVLLYALVKLIGKKKKNRSVALNHKRHKHRVNVFATAKERAFLR